MVFVLHTRVSIVLILCVGTVSSRPLRRSIATSPKARCCCRRARGARLRCVGKLVRKPLVRLAAPQRPAEGRSGDPPPRHAFSWSATGCSSGRGAGGVHEYVAEVVQAIGLSCGAPQRSKNVRGDHGG